MKIGLEYIKYRWKAKKRHGIHSPFVYDLTDKALKTLLATEDQTKLLEMWRTLSRDQRSIQITDFGAGSKSLGTERSIPSILKTSSSRGKYGKLLYQLARYYAPKRILEFGTSLGVGTSYFALGQPSAEVVTVEACPATRGVALENFNRLALDNITSIGSTFDEFLEAAEPQQFDLVFIDGHHDGTALLNYLERLEPFTHDETLFILDDIRWSTSMFEAWTSIVEDTHYHVTLDFFRMGIVARRPSQEKEHFVLHT